MPTFKQDLKLGTKVPLVKGDDIGLSAVTAEKLADGAVTAEKLADDIKVNLLVSPLDNTEIDTLFD